MGHAEVQRYLEHFVCKHALLDSIRLRTRVEAARQRPDNAWVVSAVCEGQSAEHVFDYLVVCNGHYSTPFAPTVPRLDLFRGRVVHSRDYDSPEEFRGARVLIVGARSSGVDLAREVSGVAAELHVSDRSATATTVRGAVTVHPAIANVQTDGSVLFADASSASVDVILLCTGFLYDLPFLGLGPSRRVADLHLHMFPIASPNLALVGLPYAVVPFPLFRMQALLIAALLAGRFALPSAEDMRLALALEERRRGEGSLDSLHMLGADQFQYLRVLAASAGELDAETAAYIAMLEQVYLANSALKPAYPGADDAYRRVRYSVDRCGALWDGISPHVQSVTFVLRKSFEWRATPGGGHS